LIVIVLHRITRFLLIFAVLYALFTVPIAAAQDTEPVPTDPPVPITLEDAATLLLNAIIAIVVGGLGSAPATLFLVSLFKRLPFLENIGGQTLQLFVGGILTVLLWLARRFGFELQFNSLLDVVVTAGPALLLFLSTLGVSSALYASARSANVPLLGYSRTVPVEAIGETVLEATLDASPFPGPNLRRSVTTTDYLYADADRPDEL
jgi:hypothetical protein